jgi:hypothetical protein
MGMMTFQLPAGLSTEARRELERTCMAGGPDNMPWPTEMRLGANQMTVARSVDESGYLVAPWLVDRFGLLMGTSATLIERPRPFHLLAELARGKVNQVRCQAFDWRTGGLQLDAELERHLSEANVAFGHAITGPAEEMDAAAQAALDRSYDAASHLVHAYLQQVFQIRHQRQARLDTAFACRLGNAVPQGPAAEAVTAAFNTVALPLSWSNVESEEGAYRWDASDALVEWAGRQELTITAGPLIDFSSAQLPAWLWLWERDLPSLATFMCRFVETAVRRYRGKIRRWQVAAASNCATCLSLSEEDLLQLTWRLGEAARLAVPDIELVVGIAQPWGEYMAAADRTHSPFIFADTLIRSGLNMAALDIEMVMGIEPRGSYCRDLLEASRLLDLYALLGVPLRVTLGYPSSAQPDLDADPELRVGGGCWTSAGPGSSCSSAEARAGFTPAAQADWAAAFPALAVCKPFVQGVHWVHLADTEPHQFPNCGLIDRTGAAKPSLQRLRELREQHLR